MKLMTKSISRTRKSRGRPPTGAESVHLRVLPDQAAAIDAWIARQKDGEITRPEAIRRLVELGLKAKK
jgi:predicted transcriptional regulator